VFLDKIVIVGGKPLKGEVEISGAKNAAVAIIPAAILVEGPCRIENVPQIKDVTLIIDILYRMGASIRTIDKSTVEIDCSKMRIAAAPSELSRKMRASYYLIGALLGRFSQAQVDLPGGCDFGVRPIDQHIKGFEALGAKVKVEHGIIYAGANELKANNIYLDVVSVGATINIMLAAVKAKGHTVIENAAKEPHIVDVANFLNSMGADVKGAGTDLIKINGVARLHGGNYTIIPDQIEAGTFMVAAAITGGEVLVKNIIPKHLESISAKLSDAGADIIEYDEAVLVKSSGHLTKANVKTLPYPGFPTDMHPQMAALLSVAEGTSIINESVWDNRFRYVDELKRLGANIQVDGKIAVIEGTKLSGATVKACDLRAGAAMVIAGLAANGITIIEEIEHIERGYENITEKLKSLGADIKKISTTDSLMTEKIV
jgi:UDP-N-acetylglucosamine 1-carboxyvinyltransferase